MRTKHFIQAITFLAFTAFLFTQCNDDSEKPTPSPSSQFTISPDNGNFGEVLVSKESTLEFSIRNTGDKAIQIKSISIDGENKSEFETNGTSTDIEANGSKYDFNVKFTPTSKGEKNATLSITDNTGTNTIKLKGIGKENSSSETTQDDMGKEAKIMFLHHSTGRHIYLGGVDSWFTDYNATNATNYVMNEEYFPRDGYDWSNNPYDYWNIWIKHAGNDLWNNQKTLEILTGDFDVIVWKHCFPISHISPNDGNPDVTSEHATLENFKLQYEALKNKMKEFPNTRFIVWTGAVEVESTITEAQATRTKEFFTWVKNEWDEKEDNIYVWDFYQLETEGGLYLKPEYASSDTDSHPNESFAKKAAPLFCKRIVDVIKGKGDTGSITGK